MNQVPSRHSKSCSLIPYELNARLAWITGLNAKSPIGTRRPDLELVLEYTSLAANDVEQLIEYERACCGFLSFRLYKRGINLVLTISAHNTDRAAADALLGQFEAIDVAPRSACCGTGGCA